MLKKLSTVSLALLFSGTVLATEEIIDANSLSQGIVADQALYFDINYSVTQAIDDTVNHVDLRMHWDSSALTFHHITHAFSKSDAIEGHPENDSVDFDGDSNTDQFIHVKWASLSRNISKNTQRTLYTAHFTAIKNFTDNGAIKFSQSSPSSLSFRASPTVERVLPETSYTISNNDPSLTSKTNPPSEQEHVSITLIKTPSVMGKTQRQAEDELNNMGVKVTTSMQASDSVPSGKVISQYPVAGYAVIAGSTIKLFVSNGSDGVDETMEQSAPNDGDGNNDGVADSTQANVVSIKGIKSSTKRTALTPYITVDVSQSSCTEIKNVSISPETEFGSDDLFDYDAGLVNFTLNCSEATVDIYYHRLTQAPTHIRKYGFTPQSPKTKIWYHMAGTITSETVNDVIVYKARYTLKDGELGDDDLTVNGTIIDPAGVARMVAVGVGNSTSKPIPTLSFWGLLALTSLMPAMISFMSKTKPLK